MIIIIIIIIIIVLIVLIIMIIIMIIIRSYNSLMICLFSGSYRKYVNESALTSIFSSLVII
jgi:hypothetical protein